MKSLDDLKKMREQALKKVNMRDTNKEYRVVVGMATCGIAAGARPVLNKLIEEVNEKEYSCIVTQTGCIGLCAYEPIVEIFDKNGNKTTYINVNPGKVVDILKSHVQKGIPLVEYTIDSAKK